MNTLSVWKILVVLIGPLLLSSCEYNVSVKSEYHPDGSLGRTITMSKVDSAMIDKNLFGIGKQSGWDVNVSSEDSSKQKLTISLFKSFSSIEEANLEMDNENDTLFHIRSEIETRYSWFYSYEKYKETYGSLNRFKHLSQDDYFTQEDFAFIDRLPADGVPLSKADSFYLNQLDLKVSDHFALRAFFEEGYNVLINIMKENSIESRWTDTLARHKEELFQYINRDLEGDNTEYIFAIADTLGIPLPYPKARNDYAMLSKDFNSRAKFMSDVYSGKFVHAIQLPETVYQSNADSVSNNIAYWKPRMFKFLLKDYEMFAETRKLNYWAVLVAVGVLALVVFLFLRLKEK